MIHTETAGLWLVNVICKPAACGRTNYSSLRYTKSDFNFKIFTATGEINGTITIGSFSGLIFV